MAVRRVLFCRQHNGKCRTLAQLRNHFDIAALPRYNLAGQIQTNAHALLFVYADSIRLYCHFDLFNKRFHFNETLVTLIHSIALIRSTTDCFAKMCL